jgi:hypothetical protein
MGGFASSGGGFFFSPFTFSYSFNLNIAELPGVPGDWYPIVLNTPKPGRWMQLCISEINTNTLYSLQLGIGAAGAQTVWQPTLGNFIDPTFDIRPFINTVSLPDNWKSTLKYYNFPISLPRASNLWVRVFSTAPPSPGATCHIEAMIWG